VRLGGCSDEGGDLVELEERPHLLRHLEAVNVIHRVAVDVAVADAGREYLPEQRQGLVDRHVAEATVPCAWVRLRRAWLAVHPVPARAASSSATRASPRRRSATFSAM
jgi:hypothetical protein